jgi:hypothetical protein
MGQALYYILKIRRRLSMVIQIEVALRGINLNGFSYSSEDFFSAHAHERGRKRRDIADSRV